MTMKHQVDQKQILRLFLGSLLRLQNVERGSIWIKQGNAYQCIEAMGRESDQIKGRSISNERPSIVGWVIENGRMTIGKAGEDERHFKAFTAVEAKKFGWPPKRFSDDALRSLMHYPWKGNIRELENMVRHVMVTCPGNAITLNDLPLDTGENTPVNIPASDSQRPSVTQWGAFEGEKFDGYTWKALETEYVLYLLEKHRWNITRAAMEADQWHCLSDPLL